MTAEEAAMILLSDLGVPRSLASVYEVFNESRPTLVVMMAPRVWHMRDRLPHMIGKFVVRTQVRKEAVFLN